MTVCRLVAKKGLDVLLPALALARRDLPRIALIVVGDGPERAAVEAFTARLGLSGAFRFVGRVPHEAVPAYYQAADCFALASRVHHGRRGRPDVETMGRVICEANAAGLPVVASRTGGIPSVIDHDRNGLPVPAEDPAALALALVRLGRSADLRERLRRAGISRAREEFDWSRVTRRFEEAFERSVSGPVASTP
ncbi:MAG TPA: glycosyltransferase [Dehalococcoidia bacterium]|nr:glycosyltransferase [Dehalococcoidia bacterium]